MLDEALDYQKRNGYVIWNNFDRNVFPKDMERKLQYKILFENEIACVFTVLYSDKIIWREMDNANAIYLHRIITNPKHKGKKLFASVLEWSLEDAKRKNLSYIRMDTWGDNPQLISYYESFGFRFIENYTTPDTLMLPAQHRNNYIALLEYKVDL